MDDPTENPSTKIRLATLADLRYVTHLAKKFSNEIGFIPAPAVADYLSRSAVTLALENDEPAGYLLGNPSLRWQPALRPISQAAIAYDAQRHSHGLTLVAEIERRARAAGQAGLQANCRADLDANAFWAAAGFVAVCYMTPDNARKEPIICWRKPLLKKLPLWFAAPPKRAGYKNLPPTLAPRARI